MVNGRYYDIENPYKSGDDNGTSVTALCKSNTILGKQKYSFLRTLIVVLVCFAFVTVFIGSMRYGKITVGKPLLIEREDERVYGTYDDCI
jgi:hypothetical protein